MATPTNRNSTKGDILDDLQPAVARTAVALGHPVAFDVAADIADEIRHDARNGIALKSLVRNALDQRGLTEAS